jgi:hypothetical protein
MNFRGRSFTHDHVNTGIRRLTGAAVGRYVAPVFD